MTHPSPTKLDAFAAGDANADVEAHVKECGACTKYVAELQVGVAAFRAKKKGADFAALIARDAEKPADRESDAPLPDDERAASQKPAAEGRGPKSSRAASRARMIWFAAPVLAAAAAVALFVNKSAVEIATPDLAPTESVSRFKGEVPVVVIRERDGRQARLQGPFAMHAGDRIRIEVSLDHAQPLAAGLLTKEGAWVPLLAPTTLEPGTHTPTLAVAADESPTDAMLIVGAPDAVERARTTRNYVGVTAWHVTSE